MSVMAEIFEADGAKLFDVPVQREGSNIRGSIKVDLPPGRWFSVRYWKVEGLGEGRFPSDVVIAGEHTFNLNILVEGDDEPSEKLAEEFCMSLLEGFAGEPEPVPERPAIEGYKYGGML